MKVYLVFDVMRNGIRKMDAAPDPNGYVRLSAYWASRDQWYDTAEAAIAKANQWRDKRMASLRRQLSALEKRGPFTEKDIR